MPWFVSRFIIESLIITPLIDIDIYFLKITRSICQSKLNFSNIIIIDVIQFIACGK